MSSRARTPRAALPPLRILLPLAVIISGALALAQPVLARSQPSPVGLIIDDCGFGAAGDLRRVSMALADGLAANTRWAVFTTSGNLVASGSGRQELTGVLKSYSTESGKASYSPAVFQQAGAYLKERTGAPPVLLLIGNQETFAGYPGMEDIRNALQKDGIGLFSLSANTGSRPVFIAATDMPHLARLGAQVKTRIAIANTGDHALSGEVRLTSGDKVLVRKVVNLPARSLSWQELSTAPVTPGQNRFEVTISAGGNQDQVNWDLAAFPAQKALVVAATGSSPGYIEKALKALPLVDTVTTIDPEALTVPKLHDFLSATRLAVLDGVNASLFPADLSTELAGWVQSGGTLVFACGPTVNDAWNKTPLGPLLPAAIKLRTDKRLQDVAAKDSPITRNLELESSAMTVSQWFSVDVPSKDNILMSVGGRPMLLFNRAKQGAVVMWNSTSDPRWNDWAQHPSFPAFWSNVVVYAVAGDVKTALYPSDPARSLWRSAGSPSTEKVYFVDTAAGKETSVPGEVLQELGRAANSYQDYHLPFLGLSILLALAYLAWGVIAPRMERRTRNPNAETRNKSK